MTIPNAKPDKDQFPDYFYLDASKFERTFSKSVGLRWFKYIEKCCIS